MNAKNISGEWARAPYLCFFPLQLGPRCPRRPPAAVPPAAAAAAKAPRLRGYRGPTAAPPLGSSNRLQWFSCWGAYSYGKRTANSLSTRR